MRFFLVVICCLFYAGNALTQLTDAQKLEYALQEIKDLRDLVEGAADTAGEVRLFYHRDACPKGWRIAHELDGRVPFVDHGKIGEVHGASMHEAPRRNMTSPCKEKVGTNDVGFRRICAHGDSMPVSADLREFVPGFSTLACISDNPVFQGNRKYMAAKKSN